MWHSGISKFAKRAPDRQTAAVTENGQCSDGGPTAIDLRSSGPKSRIHQLRMYVYDLCILCIYIHTYIYICMCVRVHLFISKCTFLRSYAYLSVYVYIVLCFYLFFFMYLSIHLLCMFTFKTIHSHIQCRYIYTHMLEYATCIHKYTHIWAAINTELCPAGPTRRWRRWAGGFPTKVQKSRAVFVQQILVDV